MTETEVRGELTKQEFENKLEELMTKFPNYSFNKRLTFCFGSFENKEIDLRLRITDKIPVIMQKLGNWSDLQREEIEIQLPKNEEDFFKTYKIFKNIYDTIPNSFITVIQHENHIFESEELEIKLTRQFGKSDYFVFEIEAKKPDIDLTLECKKFDLPIMETFESEEDRKKRNEEVNLDPNKLSNSQLQELIKKYM